MKIKESGTSKYMNSVKHVAGLGRTFFLLVLNDVIIRAIKLIKPGPPQFFSRRKHFHFSQGEKNDQ